MSTPVIETSRAFVVDLPERMAKQVEEMAREEKRSPSELLRESFRLYKMRKAEIELEAIRRDSSPTTYTPDDIEGFVDEVRQQMYEEREAERARRP